MSNQTKIKQFPEIELSDDGGTVIVTAEFVGKSAAKKWAVPYRHAVWLARAILAVAHKAVERQAARGTIEPSAIAIDPLLVESVTVVCEAKGRTVGDFCHRHMDFQWRTGNHSSSG
jgi:hypothetical protein